jgi:acyl carrier protein
MPNNALEKVSELIANQLPVKAKDVTLESRLVEDLGADSANVMILIMDLEQAFDIEVDDEALGSIKTVGDIIAYLENRV